MKLNTGKVKFLVEFDNGDKDFIYFNPNDPNLSIRLINLEEKIMTRIKELDDIQLKPDGSSIVENFRKLQEVLLEELDIAFGGKISSIVFKHCSPFAIVGGEFFITQFIEAIKPEIQKQIKKTNSEIEKKMSKHLDKYKK